MNSPIRRLSTVVAFLFATLLVSTTWIQFVQAKSLNARPDNRRTLLSSYGRDRGQLLVADKPIARSVPVSDEYKWQRTYASGPLYAHVTGYYSFIYGAQAGLEAANNDLLSGSSDKLFYKRLSDMLTGKQSHGASLQLTINPAVQAAADKALGNQRGAAVALDPRTGAILALVSHPSYDPNKLASHNIEATQKAYETLAQDTARPLLDRAIGGDLYPPGSTFKLVTTAAALESGTYTATSELPGPAELDLPLTTTNLPNQPQLAQAAIGQYDVRMTPMQIAMIASAIANGGSVMKPYLVKSAIVDSDLSVLESAKPTELSRAISGTTAETMLTMMQSVVTDGTGTAARIEGVTVAGKTGTADHGVGLPPHAWFTGFAPADRIGSARIAVAVVVEDGGNAGSEAAGGSVAGPIARAMMKAALGS